MGNSSDSLLPKAGHVTEFACRPGPGGERSDQLAGLI